MLLRAERRVPSKRAYWIIQFKNSFLEFEKRNLRNNDGVREIVTRRWMYRVFEHALDELLRVQTKSSEIHGMLNLVVMTQRSFQ